MDTKKELVERLSVLMPGMAEEIASIIGEYRISREPSRERGGLDRKVAAFLAAKKIDGLSPKTLKNYREMLGAFAAKVEKPVTRIDSDDIRGYIAYLAQERELKDSSIQTHVNTLCSFFSWLDQEDAIKRNPMRKIKSIKLDKLQARRPLTPEELERLRDGCCTYREKALVEFLVSSGCRLSETVGIRVDQIDWRERSVEVLGKGGKRRVVYFSVRAALMIQAYMEQRRGGEALFASSKAPYEPMSPRAIERAVETVGVRAGERRRIHPHLLRHTFATNALHAGMDLTVIQHLLGHSDPKTTMIYAELRPDAVKYAYERVIA